MKFNIKCLECGTIYPPERYIIKCPNGCDSLLRTEYKKKQISKRNLPGMWKYVDWLPVNNIDKNLLVEAGSTTYKSEILAKKLKLNNLIISFNGYWPEKGANQITCSFKDLEAQTVLQRINETGAKGKVLVVATDGNTGKSFLHFSSIIKYPLVVFAKEKRRKEKLWTVKPPKGPIKVLTLAEGNDYYDVICLSEKISQLEGFVPEGGTRNIARRDGMGTLLLDAAFLEKKIPDHYFQALGSGPGAIAAYEASLRLINDGRFGDKLPKIHGCQNYPFVPMYDAWMRKSKIIDKKFQDKSAKKLIDQVLCTALANRHPAYSIKGGIYDVLSETNGEFYSVTNDEILYACKLFEETEGIDIEEPAGVALAGLIQSIEKKKVNIEDCILLNISGGGFKRLKNTMKIHQMPASFVVKNPDEQLKEVTNLVKGWF
jgi:cysteate synthase